MWESFLIKIVGPATVIVAALAMGGPVWALTNEEIANLMTPDRQAILEAGAKKEGEVLFYTTLIVNQAARPMAAAFEEKYPFLKLKFVRSDSTQTLQRVMAENRAGSIRVDVIDGDIAAALMKAGLSQPFNSPILAEYPKDYVEKDRHWVSTRNSWQGIAWNTNLVKDSEAPKSWEDLLDPKWKGKMAWGTSSGTGAPRLITHLRKVWGEDKAMDYLKKLRQQDIRTLPGSIRVVLDQIIAGEYAIGVSMAMHHIAISRDKGAPITGTSPEPSLARMQALQFIKGAPHPHAGMLLMDYLIAADGGQVVLRNAKFNPSHPGVKPLPTLAWFQPNLIGRAEMQMLPQEEDQYRGKSVDIYKSMFR